MSKCKSDDNVADDGYRPNVGIILCNCEKQVLWARRSGHDGWQFPQGGVRPDETPEEALFRELYEEVGLQRDHVRIVARTHGWLKYDLPERYRRRRRAQRPDLFRGQKQIWYLLQMLCDDSTVCLDTSASPEFDEWRWIDYWSALENIVDFKRQVYELALVELERYLLMPTPSIIARRRCTKDPGSWRRDRASVRRAGTKPIASYGLSEAQVQAFEIEPGPG